jgi:hypothetical protein
MPSFRQLSAFVQDEPADDARAMTLRAALAKDTACTLVKATDRHGNTLLHLACGLGKRLFAEALYEAGGSLVRRTLIGYTPADLIPADAQGDRWFMVRRLHGASRKTLGPTG